MTSSIEIVELNSLLSLDAPIFTHPMIDETSFNHLRSRRRGPMAKLRVATVMFNSDTPEELVALLGHEENL